MLVGAMRVSIIVRTMSGRKSFLASALLSIRRQQTGHPIQTIVVVDGDTPAQLDGLIQSEEVVRLGAQRGRAGAANAGLDAARGEAVNFLDDDDFFHPHHVATLVPFLEMGYNAAYAAAFKREADLNESAPEKSVFGASVVHYKPLVSSIEIARENHFPIQAVMFKRALLARGTRFREALVVLEDWMFWQEVLIGSDIAHSPTITSTFHVPLNEADRQRRIEEHERAHVILADLRCQATVPLACLAETISMYTRAKPSD